MGGISNDQIEWAVVDRLRKLLEEPPKTKFNVTQSFSIFATIVLWTKNRAWADDHAKAVLASLKQELIVQAPWSLGLVPPPLKLVLDGTSQPASINGDFRNKTAAEFFEWVRHRLAHGDGRSITPLHKYSAKGKVLLAGFEIAEVGRRRSTLTLYHDDMRCVGATLADRFCTMLSGGNKFFETEADARVLEQAA